MTYDYRIASIRCSECGFSSLHFENSTAIQIAVFVAEQGVPLENVIHGQYETTHYVLYVRLDDGWEPAACARVLQEFRSTPRAIKIQRVAVLPEYRGQKFARRLLEYLIEEQGKRYSPAYFYLHSQMDACGLYEAMHFEAVGDPFVEADKKHLRMELTWNGSRSTQA